MLTAILGHLKSGKTFSQHDLSQALSVDENIIRTQIEFLEQQGYLQRIQPPSCEGRTCSGCKGCERSMLPVMWEINKNIKKTN